MPAFDGVTVLELLTRVSQGQCTSLRARRPDLPPGLADAVERAMAVEPSARFASVREFGLALLPFADELTRALWTAAFKTVRPRPSRSRCRCPWSKESETAVGRARRSAMRRARS